MNRSKKSDAPDSGQLELVRIPEEAIPARAKSVVIESERGKRAAYLEADATGIGVGQIADHLYGPVVRELRRGARPSTKGKSRIVLLGQAFELTVQESESFGEPVFRVALQER